MVVIDYRDERICWLKMLSVEELSFFGDSEILLLVIAEIREVSVIVRTKQTRDKSPRRGGIRAICVEESDKEHRHP